jgi:hypothetical protein
VTDLTKLPEAPAGFVWLDEMSLVRVDDIQAIQVDHHVVRVGVRHRDGWIVIQEQGRLGSEIGPEIIARIRSVVEGSE